jgi:3,4-dihydroxy 2-butanone 4-phosphate synthase
MTINTFTLQSNDLQGRIAAALEATRAGIPVILLDDFDRENEADLIVAAEKLSDQTMALMIRECSGIVCLCLPNDKVRALELPPMAAENGSRYGTPFTVSIEAREGVTTGVSAADRVTTIRAAIARDAKPADLVRPGHVFPLRANPAGVLGRAGPHRRLGRPGDHGGAGAGGGAVRADERGWDDDARGGDRAVCP